MKAWLFAALLAVVPGIAHGADFAGKVVRIIDGDTLEVLHDRSPVRVRLEGIDCPEKAQPFGTKARQFAAELAFNELVTVKDHGKDRYGRTLGEVVLPDGRSLNQELVRAGFAWWYRRYSKDKTLEALEAAARAEKRGLWADPHAVAPWDWRRGKRPQTGLESLGSQWLGEEEVGTGRSPHPGLGLLSRAAALN